MFRSAAQALGLSEDEAGARLEALARALPGHWCVLAYADSSHAPTYFVGRPFSGHFSSCLIPGQSCRAPCMLRRWSKCQQVSGHVLQRCAGFRAGVGCSLMP